jgi:O-methyltransferase
MKAAFAAQSLAYGACVFRYFSVDTKTTFFWRLSVFTLAQRGIHILRDLDREKALHKDITDEVFWSIVPRVWDYSELPTEILFNLYSAARYIAEANIAGDFVECGVHLGGSIMMMEHALLLGDNQPGRRIFALDTFYGFVRRTEGLDVDIETGAATCIPSEIVDDYTEASSTNMRSVGFDKLHIVKGDVFETIPTLDTKSISLLRLDTDTYDTTKFELERLYDYVVPGGVVIIEDYGYPFGCKKAVDDFVASRPILLQRINRNVRAWVKAA